MNVNNLISMPSIAIAKYAIDNYKGLDEMTLAVLKKEMLRRNFHMPMQFLISLAAKEIEDKDEKEMEDIKKQLRYFRQIALLKKLSLRQVSFCLYWMKIRKKIKEDMRSFLPDFGDYMTMLFKLKYGSAIIFKELYDLLSSHGIEKEKEMSIIEEQGFTYEMPTAYALAQGLNEIKRQKRVIIKPIIRSSFVRKILCSAAVNYGYKNLISNFKEQDAEMIDYNKILISFSITPYSRLDTYEGFDYVKQALHAKGFADFDGFVFSTKKYILDKLIERRKYFYSYIRKNALQFLYQTIKFAIENKAFLPTMARKPAKEQIKILYVLKEKMNEINNA
ncbi:MAG: hypothetical protein QXI89_00630 [Candidatus Anstonellales archaeon]